MICPCDRWRWIIGGQKRDKLTQNNWHTKRNKIMLNDGGQSDKDGDDGVGVNDDDNVGGAIGVGVGGESYVGSVEGIHLTKKSH